MVSTIKSSIQVSPLTFFHYIANFYVQADLTSLLPLPLNLFDPALAISTAKNTSSTLLTTETVAYMPSSAPICASALASTTSSALVYILYATKTLDDV